MTYDDHRDAPRRGAQWLREPVVHRVASVAAPILGEVEEDDTDSSHGGEGGKDAPLTVPLLVRGWDGEGAEDGEGELDDDDGLCREHDVSIYVS